MIEHDYVFTPKSGEADVHEADDDLQEPGERSGLNKTTYRFCVEIDADDEIDARERLEEVVAQEGWGFDLESSFPAEGDEEETSR